MNANQLINQNIDGKYLMLQIIIEQFYRKYSYANFINLISKLYLMVMYWQLINSIDLPDGTSSYLDQCELANMRLELAELIMRIIKN